MGIIFSGETVVISDLTINDKELSNYLGESSDPEEAVKQLILVGNRMRSSFQSTLETQNIRNAANDLMTAMQEKYTKMVEDLTKSIDSLLEKDKGALALRIKELAEREIKPMLDPSIGDLATHGTKSPMHELKRAITKHIDDFEERIEAAVGDIKDILDDGDGERGPAEGFDFEDLVSRLIMPIARVHGDSFIPTGTKQTSSGALIGDALVEINPEYKLGKNLKVVWEMKSDKKFKHIRSVKDNGVNLDKVREELNKALEQRAANVGVFVLDDSELNKTLVPDWVELDGNKLLILVDEKEPDSEMLKLAYLWSRWKSLANSDSQSSLAVNAEEVSGQISSIRIKLNLCNSISKNLGTASRMVSDAATQVRGLRLDVRDMLLSLEDLLQIETEEEDLNAQDLEPAD